MTVVIGGLLIRGRPEDVGQQPDGISDEEGPFSSTLPTAFRGIYQTPIDWTANEAMHTPAFWMIMALFAITLFATNMLTTHQVAYLQDLHFPPFMSATALGLMIGMSIIGRLACGLLGMRFEGRYLAALFLVLMELGIMALIGARGISWVYLYSILTGIGFGGMVVLVPNFLGAYFGRTHYSRIIGWISPGVVLISAGSPSLAEFFYDATGNYIFPFTLAAALIFAGAILALLTRPPQRVKKPVAEYRELQ